MDFYVYVHKRKDNGEPFYVGKGRGDRAWSTESRTTAWRKVVAVSGRDVEVVMRGMGEDAALSFEKMLISALSIRFKLVNRNKGGGGRRPKFDRFYLMHNGEECWINIPRYVPPKPIKPPKPITKAKPRRTYGLTGKQIKDIRSREGDRKTYAMMYGLKATQVREIQQWRTK